MSGKGVELRYLGERPYSGPIIREVKRGDLPVTVPIEEAHRLMNSFPGNWEFVTPPVPVPLRKKLVKV